MSGGSYEYAYYKLESLADSIACRENHKLLRQRTAALLRRMAKIAKDIEWIDSGDCGEEDWKIVKKQLDEIGEFNEDARKEFKAFLKKMQEDCP